jgi:hypothetical protein
MHAASLKLQFFWPVTDNLLCNLLHLLYWAVNCRIKSLHVPRIETYPSSPQPVVLL